MVVCSFEGIYVPLYSVMLSIYLILYIVTLFVISFLLFVFHLHHLACLLQPSYNDTSFYNAPFVWRGLFFRMHLCTALFHDVFYLLSCTSWRSLWFDSYSFHVVITCTRCHIYSLIICTHSRHKLTIICILQWLVQVR